MSDYVKAVEQARREKDEAFRHDPHSPIPDRASFKGLSYYPVDPRYRFETRLVPHAEPKRLAMQTSDGQARDYLNVGHFEVEIDGEPVKVQAYDSGRGHGLFVPFRDKTSGKETYGAGRYLDLHPEGPHEAYVLDFNLAYHPLCAYDEAYSCPFPPPENWLQVPIRAGERMP